MCVYVYEDEVVYVYVIQYCDIIKDTASIDDPYTDAVDAITTGRGGRTATTGQRSSARYPVSAVFRSR